MPDKINPALSGVSETLLMPLYARASETRRPDAMIRDEKAAAMAGQMDYDFSHFGLQEHDRVAIILRMREFDRMTRDFLARNPHARVVHIGCGLDTRFERVDDGQVEWYDLDLPPVTALRQRLIGDQGPRHHLLSASVFAADWLEQLDPQEPSSILFLAEGVLPYFETEQVKSLVLRLRQRYPGAELVCDGQTPFMIWANNLQLAVFGVPVRLHWGLSHARDVEAWGEGITLLEEWYYFDRPEPRLGAMQVMGRMLFRKSTGVYHYRLG